MGWFRRNLLVSVPEAGDLNALNEQVLADCVANRDRTIIGRSMTIGMAGELEREHLSPPAAEGFPIHELLYPPLVDGKGRVKVKTNWYSSPLWPGLRVTAVVGPLTVKIMHDNKVAAEHPRCYAGSCISAWLSHPQDGSGLVYRQPSVLSLKFLYKTGQLSPGSDLLFCARRRASGLGYGAV